MRVIAGIYRSRQLVAPKGMNTRPTSDRLRETLFDILMPRMEGCRFADLYAGTGAVGIEAISRGAAQVWFAEKAAPALAAMRANLRKLGVSAGFAIEERGTAALLDRLTKQAENSPEGLVDVVYLDPPWDAEAEYEKTLHVLGSVRGQAMLEADALVIAEHNSKASLAERYGALARTRTRKQGDAALSFYAMRAD